MKIKRIAISMCVLLSVITLSGCSSKDTVLKLRVKEGDSYTLQRVDNSKFTINMLNKDMSVEDKENYDMSINVKNVENNGDVILNYKYKRINMEYNTYSGNIAYNSEKKDSNNPLNTIYDNIMKQDCTITLNKNGKVLHINGIDGMINNLVQKAKLDDNTRELTRTCLNENFSDDSVRKYIEDTMNYTNGNRIKPGDKWTKKSSLRKSVDMNIISKYTFNSEKDGLINLAEKDTISSGEKAKEIYLNDLKAKVDLKGNGNGKLSIDKRTGLIHNTQIKYDISGFITFLQDNNAGILQDIKAPVNFAEDVNYKIIK